MSYTVEQNIPLPPRAKAGPKPKYPLCTMEIGESFYYTGNAPAIRSLATKYAGRSGKTFETRAVDGGIRIWRTT